MRGALALVLVVTSACRIEDHLVPCGDLACPVGLVCTTGGCATPESAAACASLVDGDMCTSATVPDGTCTGGACYAVGCGNGVLDHGEACDDGNNTYLDGCSADCRSDETCGNAVPDPLSGEQCDSGVRGLSSDGCTSRCTNEIEIWRDRSPAAPSGRGGPELAYDSARGVVVMFGGYDGNWRTETWEWNGHNWRRMRTPVSPPGRNNHAMAYDAARKRVVLYGGTGAFTTKLSDTWEWDGVTWVERTPATQPGAMWTQVMAFDPIRSVIVMFGGRRADNTVSDDVWEWNGTNWTLRMKTTPWPSPRISPAFAWDPDLDQLLLFGGIGTNVLQDTWSWDGTQWTQRAPVASPPARYAAVAASDASRVILAGGTTLAANTELSDAWEWTGTNWVPLPAAPAKRASAGLAFDAARAQFVHFGGTLAEAFSGETWLFTDAWSVAPAPTSPGPRSDHALAYDSLRGRVVLFGGRTGSTRYGDTWEWDGANWLSVATTGPAPRFAHTMTFHPRFGVVMFGGNSAGPTLRNDLWAWDGETWQQLAASGPLQPRSAHSMTYDAHRDRLVVFGGATPELGDTWEWDGTTWSAAATGPAPRITPSLSYDPVRERVVMIGGVAANLPLGDAWEWDGTTWAERGAIASPLLPRGNAAAVYDPFRQATTLFGGISYFLGRLDETLEWNGQSITLRTVPLTPGPRNGSSLAYDTIAHTLVTYGGENGNTPFESTWLRLYESYEHPVERCLLDEDGDGDGLAGCADPDCFGRCAPLCPPGVTCPSDAPRCGDGTCSPVEDYLICDADCDPS